MKVELLHDSREVFIRGCLDIEYIDLVNFLKKECQERNIPNAKVIDFRRINNGNILIVDEETKRYLFGYKMPRREAYLINLEVANNEVLHVVDDEEYYQLGVIENGKYRDEQVHPQDKDVEPYIDVEVIEYLLKGQGAIEEAEEHLDEIETTIKAKEVFVLTGKSGEYDETREWTQGVYLTKQAAIKAMHDLDEKAYKFFADLKDKREAEIDAFVDLFNNEKFEGNQDDFYMEKENIEQKHSLSNDEVVASAKKYIGDEYIPRSCGTYIDYMFYPSKLFKE